MISDWVRFLKALVQWYIVVISFFSVFIQNLPFLEIFAILHTPWTTPVRPRSARVSI